jgi:hypothetical protein
MTTSAKKKYDSQGLAYRVIKNNDKIEGWIVIVGG